MMKSDPILEQDILIGRYTLGLLSPQETHRVEALLGRDPAAARTALHWEETFLTLVDALPPTPPPGSVLDHILTTLDLPLPAAPEMTATAEAPSFTHTSVHREPGPSIAPPVTAQEASTPKEAPAPKEALTAKDAPAPGRVDVPITQAASKATNQTATPVPADTFEPTAQPHSGSSGVHSPLAQERQRRSRRIWLGGASAVIVAALLTLAFMPRQPAEPPVVIVEVAPSKGAILLAPGQSSTPGWVVTIDLENNATLTPQVHTEMSAEASVQLWTYSKSLPQPRSLGLIDPNRPVAIPAELMGEISDDQFFEMTLEPAGGSPSSEPSGPILFIGRVVTFS